MALFNKSSMVNWIWIHLSLTFYPFLPPRISGLETVLPSFICSLRQPYEVDQAEREKKGASWISFSEPHDCVRNSTRVSLVQGSKNYTILPPMNQFSIWDTFQKIHITLYKSKKDGAELSVHGSKYISCSWKWFTGTCYAAVVFCCFYNHIPSLIYEGKEYAVDMAV